MSLIPEGFTEQEFNDLKNSDPEFAKVLIDELKQNISHFIDAIDVARILLQGEHADFNFSVFEDKKQII